MNNLQVLGLVHNNMMLEHSVHGTGLDIKVLRLVWVMSYCGPDLRCCVWWCVRLTLTTYTLTITSTGAVEGTLARRGARRGGGVCDSP